MLKCLDILSITFCLITYKLLTPVAVLDPDVEPDSSDGIDGVAKDHGTVHFEILAPFSFFGELLHGLGIAEVLRNQEIREQVGILGDCAHEIPHVVVLAAPTVHVLSFGDFGFYVGGECTSGNRERVTVRVVEESVVVFIDFVGLGDKIFPLLFDAAVDILFVGIRAGIAVQRHVAVGNVVAEDKEHHGDVVAGGGDGAALFFAGEHFEVVDNAMANCFAAVCAVAAVDAVGLAE